MQRYSVIEEKRKREIVLLRGGGCFYKKCAFCDYHFDYGKSEEDNFALNRKILDMVTGIYGELEVINSGSVFELDGNTLNYIKEVCRTKGVKTVHFESHYLLRDKIPALKEQFAEFKVIMKLGLETFDYNLRENVLKKGIPERDPQKIADGFDEANFLFGINGQTRESMQSDIELGLNYFNRICINIMCGNSTAIAPDKGVIEEFTRHIYPVYRDNDRVDILIENTDFGVG